MPPIPFVAHLEQLLEDAGLSGAGLVHSRHDEQHFGNSLAVFAWGAILLRFVRDRSQEFLDIAMPAAPKRFYQFSDLAVAWGWTTLEAVIARRDPEPLGQVLARMAQHSGELQAAFSEPRAAATRAELERAAGARGQAFITKLRRLRG